MDAYEGEILDYRHFTMTPTPDVSEASESEDEGAQDIISEHDTDTEQEPDEDDNQSDTSSTTSRSLYFYGGDGTKWKKHAPGQRVRTRQQNIVTQLPGVRAGARNAFIINKTNNPDGEFSKSRRLFLENLGKDLVIENMKLRANMPNLPRNVRLSAAKFSGVSVTEEPRPTTSTARRRCKFCKDRKSRYSCKFCGSWICLEHTKPCCADCAAKFD